MPFVTDADENERQVPQSRLRLFAFVIGIDEYLHGIPPLETAVDDARAVARVLIREHGCRVLLLTRLATAKKIKTVVERILPALVREDVALVFYFAGHGIALPSETGPRGYLVPAGATRDPASFVEMGPLHAALGALPCRHLLAILDCCFAGAFRWGAALGDRRLVPDFMFRRTYELYLEGKARQVLVSAAADQRALELLSGEAIRGRTAIDGTARHSPFALALLSALSGQGPPGKGGVLTVTELSEYLRRQVEALSDAVQRRQTPQLWPLEGHDTGEFLFHLPGQPLVLAENPRLTLATNPWRGLRTYEAEDAALFHGRAKAVAALFERAVEEPFVVLLGESGSGKSSLLRAGLLPCWEEKGWEVLLVPDLLAGGKLRPLRPGSTPLAELIRLPAADGTAPVLSEHPLPADWLARLVAGWLKHLPAEVHLLLCVDQFEELVTLGREVGHDTREQEGFQAQLAAALALREPRLHVVLTLRSDYASDFSRGPLTPWWQREALFRVPPLAPAELRQIVQLPASSVALDFAVAEDVDLLVAEVALTTNPLPPLSCALSEIYESYVAANDQTRSLQLPADFVQVGGVAGALGRSGGQIQRELPDDFHRAMLDHVLLRFVAVEGGHPARRRVLKEELRLLPHADRAARRVIGDLATRRLLVAGQTETGVPFWELCHDRLLTGWAHYRELIQERRETILLQRRLTADMASDRDNLWDNEPRLPQVRRLLDDPASWLNLAEEDFVRRSVGKKRGRAVRLVAGTMAVLVAVSIGAFFAWQQREAARTQTEQNFAIGLAAQAETRPDAEADQAVLLAMAAHDIFDTPETRFSLFAALARRPQLQRSHHFAALQPLHCAAGAHDGRLFVWGQRGLLELDLAADGGLTASRPILKDRQVVSVARHPQTGALTMIVGGDCLFVRDGKWQRIKVDFKDDDPRCVAWQPTGSLLAIGCTQTIRLVEMTGEPEVVRQFEVPLRKVSTGGLSRKSIETIAWKPDGLEVAALSGPLMFFVPADRDRPMRTMNRLPDVTTVAYKQGGKEITHNQNGELIGPGKGTPLHFAWHPDASAGILCTPTEEKTLTVWHADDGERIAEVPLEAENFARVSWSPDGRKLAVGIGPDRVLIFAFEDRQRADLSPTPGVLRKLHELKTDVSDLAWLGERLATVEENGAVRIWSFATGEPYFALRTPGAPKAMAWQPSGERLAVATAESRLRLIPLPSALLPAQTPEVVLDGFLDVLRWNADGELHCFGRKGLRRVQLDSLAVKDVSAKEPPPFRQAALSPDARTVVLLPEVDPFSHTEEKKEELGRTLLLFDAHSGLTRATRLSTDGHFSDPAWSPDGAEFAIVEGPRISLLRAAPDQVVKRLSLGENASYSLPVFSPDGRRLAAAVNDGEVRVWDAREGRLLASFRAHPNACRALAWLSEDLLTTGNREDERIMLWQAATTKLIGSLPAGRFCEQLAAHPPSGKLAMNWQEQEVRLFWTDLARCKSLAQRTVNRPLSEVEWRTFVGANRDYPKVSSGSPIPQVEPK